MGKRLIRQSTPVESARVLFVGSAVQFARGVLEKIAKEQSCDPEARLFVQRFLANSLLMSERMAWGADGWGVPYFALTLHLNPTLQRLLADLVPHDPLGIPRKIKTQWPQQVVDLFADLARTPARQNQLKGIVLRPQPRGESYLAIARLLGKTDRGGQELVWGRLMHKRFRFVDQLVPLPDLTAANARRIIEAWSAARVPNLSPVDGMGVPLFQMRSEKRTGLT